MSGVGTSLYGFPPNQEESHAIDVGSVKVKSYLRHFSDETSLHGVPHLVRHKGWFRKFFWLICIAASCYALFWEFSIFYSKVTLWKPVTLASYQRHSKLYFPAVTICNNNPAVTRITSGLGSGGGGGGSGIGSGSEGSLGGGSGDGSGSGGPSGGGSDGGSGSGSGSGSGGGSGSGSGGGPGKRRRKRSTDKEQQSGIGKFFIQALKNKTHSQFYNFFVLPVPIVKESYTISESICNQSYPTRLETGHQFCDLFFYCHFKGKSCDFEK